MNRGNAIDGGWLQVGWLSMATCQPRCICDFVNTFSDHFLFISWQDSCGSFLCKVESVVELVRPVGIGVCFDLMLD